MRWQFLLLLFSPILFAWAGEILESEIHHYVFDDTDTKILATNEFAFWAIPVNFSDLKEPLDYIGIVKNHINAVTKAQKASIPDLIILDDIVNTDFEHLEKTYHDILKFYTGKTYVGPAPVRAEELNIDPGLLNQSNHEMSEKLRKNYSPEDLKAFEQTLDRIKRYTLLTKRDETIERPEEKEEDDDDVLRQASDATSQEEENEESHGTLHRVKRFITALLAAAGGFIGSAISSLFSSNKLEAVSTQALAIANGNHEDITAVIEVAKKLGHDIHSNSLDISELARSVAKIMQHATLTSTEVKYDVVTLYVTHLMKAVERKLQLYVEAIKAGNNGKLAFGLVSYREAKLALRSIKKKAKQKGLVSFIQDPHHFMQLDTSIVRTDVGFNVLVEVPLYHDGQIFNVYRYHSFPMSLTDKMVVRVDPDESILALSDEHYLTLTQDYLSTCTRFANYHVCPDIMTIPHKSMNSCLLALYNSDHDTASKLCELSIHQVRDEALALSRNEFLAYTMNPSMYKLICANGTLRDFQLPKISKITVDDDCYADLPSFRLQPKSSLVYNKPLTSYKWNYQPLSMLNDTIDFAGLEKTLKEIAHRKLPPSDFHELLNRHRVSQYKYFGQSQNFFTWIGISTCGGLCILLIMCYVKSAFTKRNYVKVSKKNTDNNGNDEESG